MLPRHLNLRQVDTSIQHGGLASAARRGTLLIAGAKASKPAGKGFGKTAKPDPETVSAPNAPEKPGSEDRQVFRDAAVAARTGGGYRPVTMEEASRGKLDYVQVADWGSGDRSKLGELRMVSHVTQYEGVAAAGPGSTATDGSAGARAGAGAEAPRTFGAQLGQQLQMAEARGALAVAGPPPPPLAQWSFREARYVQYLADQLEVHTALEAALTEATQSAASTSSSSPSPDASAPPPQGAAWALLPLAPGRLGLERSSALQSDLRALRTAAGSAAASGASGGGGVQEPGSAQARTQGEKGQGAAHEAGLKPQSEPAVEPGPMARSYAQLLRRLGREAASGESDKERQAAGLRLLAHAAVAHVVGQAAGVRVGAAAAEVLALLQRRAAAFYHAYPEQVADPKATLARALDAAGRHLASPVARQAVFEELPSAMQKTSLLLASLAHKD
ncbi:hypothetical protein HYH03_011680 [Edaphochlamys debaryana]|uniref:Uncharacterized protein n=1 Tax=Edaphochlamys debaryana TaxID=47281 RepID=A0A835XVL3_9CHLO|nr:hypothetical protein HYH03_011680 [Edaphochlamys debaryana]|eukprot:KAG2489878.1 hypothetical protein HYH03_011680 [Edaphochlamys debaryana]